MALAITPDGRGLILEGELDMASEDEFAAAFHRVLAGEPVTVDMRQLRFMDSSGIKGDRGRGQGRP